MRKMPINESLLGSVRGENDVTWNELQSMKQSRKHHVDIKVQNSLYVAGGYDEKIASQCFIMF